MRFLPLHEWAALHGRAKTSAAYHLHQGRLPGAQRGTGGRWLVPANCPWPHDKRTGDATKRDKGLSLLAAGHPAAEVARRTGRSVHSVWRWARDARTKH